MTSILYVVATPIGNLEDVSFRTLRTLKEVDLILCEDTRVTKKLLNHYQIKTSVISYHQHSKPERENQIVDFLNQRKNLAIVSDAGTPGISDPGNKLIERLINSQIDGLKIIPVPGPTALTAASSISGLAMDKFVFMGFPPIKKKRTIFFTKVISSEFPVIFYESPYKIIKTLEEIKSLNSEAFVVVCRELTKKFETVHRGKIGEVIEKIKGDKIKGEFTVIIKNK
ncbi:16S rRNA (cytidine(1402)-2'-O)-methyltransferase [Patescibacteria group bacterium]